MKLLRAPRGAESRNFVQVSARPGLVVAIVVAMSFGLIAIGAATKGAAAPKLLRPPQGEVNDYKGGLDDLVFGPEYVVFRGRVVKLEQNGIGNLLRELVRYLGVGKRAYKAAKERARPLGLNPGLLLASEKIARVRARQLQQLLPPIERERFKTIAVAIGRDPQGSLRLVIGTNNRNSVLPKALQPIIARSGEMVATGMGQGHAEVQILRWMLMNRWRAITVGAGRPICAECADAIARAGATAASALK
jgi:hypothetical protein